MVGGEETDGESADKKEEAEKRDREINKTLDDRRKTVGPGLFVVGSGFIGE